MKKIAIIGKGDKRAFVYPTLNVCKLAAKTCVITDDVTYKRLYSGYDNTDYIEGIEINIIPLMPEEPSEERLNDLNHIIEEKEEEGYNLIFYIFDGYYPKDADKIIAVVTQTKTFLGWELDSFKAMHKGKVSYAYMSMYYKEASKDVTIHIFDWKISYFMYFARVEEFKTLRPFKEKDICKYLAHEFCEPLDISESTFLKLVKLPKKAKV